MVIALFLQTGVLASALFAEEKAAQMDPNEFVNTKAAQLFVAHNYDGALSELSLLETQYPKDFLIKRYKGIVLTRLNRLDEAIRAFDDGLTIARENAALRYFKALALYRDKKIDEARDELILAAVQDTSGEYKRLAERDIAALDKILASRKSKSPWSGVISIGVGNNSNATAERTKRRVPANQHSFKFPVYLGINYKLYSEGSWTWKIGYSESDSFYSATPFLNVVSHSPNLSLTYAHMLNGRLFIAQAASAYMHTTVNKKYYASSYPQTLTLIYSFADWHRIIVSDRVTPIFYKVKGSNPLVTSKQGIPNMLSVTNNFYLNKEKTLYLQAGFDWDYEDLTGWNFVKNAYGTTGGLYFPFFPDLFDKWMGSMTVRYVYSRYPVTAARISPRADNEIIPRVSLTIPVFDDWKLTGYYQYTGNRSNDPNFQYGNHEGGALLSRVF